ncbi:hypothetical protein [Gordonia sp. ABSL49_1]|uniref:hypothetical protein n=1 Tax=Gordonia sp. ABSL49_1 TaxID=2920941 RepID=UPI001F0E308F|nr:hypothetical protein [Gordonia sp. ABSL49_1]MCH5644156.1 hypothetical protein [Gordonia sp. ABSL49_1]
MTQPLSETKVLATTNSETAPIRISRHNFGQFERIAINQGSYGISVPAVDLPALLDALREV